MTVLKKPKKRKIRIIATIGPDTISIDTMRSMAEAGMDCIRINMSHADHSFVKRAIKNIRQLNKEGFLITTMMDLQGPEIRTNSREQDIHLNQGDTFTISVASEDSSIESDAYVNYKSLTKDVKIGNTIFIDDGSIALKVMEKGKTQLRCRVLNKGILGSKKGVNLPGIKIRIPSVTRKDYKDLAFGARLEIDIFALSFIRNNEDVQKAKQKLAKLGSDAWIFSKIEDHEGVKNLNGIIKESDGIIVGRGDLGIEFPLQEVPLIQKDIIGRCIRKRKPVYVGTQVLESMVNNSRPTRAEVTDIANTVLEKADGILLATETAIGKYPVRSIHVLDQVAKRVEQELMTSISFPKYSKLLKSELSRLACLASAHLRAKAIVVFTYTGRLARLVVKNRPTTKVIAFCPNERTMLKSNMLWGVESYSMQFLNSKEQMMKEAIKILKHHKRLRKNDLIIVVSDIFTKEDLDTLVFRKIK